MISFNKKSQSGLIQVISRIISLYPHISLRLLPFRMQHAACYTAIVSPLRALKVMARFFLSSSQGLLPCLRRLLACRQRAAE
jgi:hypothetical protein